MIKKLTYEDKDSMIELINTRNTLFFSTSSALSSYSFIENKDVFNSNIVFGYFENEQLDAFAYCTLWLEFPAYSWILYTRKRDSRIKNIHGEDSNLRSLCNFTETYVGTKLNLWTRYAVISTKWQMYDPQLRNRIVQDTLEVIPAGEFSKYDLFRHRLLNRKLDHPVKIDRLVIKPEYRGIDD